MAKTQTASKKIKKKKWFPVVAPKILGGKIIGESLLTDSSLMKNRLLTVNLMNLTGDPKKQNTNVQLHIKNVKDGQGHTEIVKIERLNSFIKRMVRRGRKKIDDSFLGTSGDNKRTRIKTLVITNNYVVHSVATKLRMELRKQIKDILKKSTFEKMVDEILKGAILKELKGKVSKITPVRVVDIRSLKIEVSKDDLEEPELEAEKSVETDEKAVESKVDEKIEEKDEPDKIEKATVVEEEKVAKAPAKKVEKKAVAKAAVKKPAAAPARKTAKAPAKKTAKKEA